MSYHGPIFTKNKFAPLLLSLVFSTTISDLSAQIVTESVPVSAFPQDTDRDATNDTYLSLLAGEHYDARTGRMGHYNTDLSASGNGSLSININRRFTMQPDQPRAGNEMYPDLFGSMALDIPRLEFTSFESVLHPNDDTSAAATQLENNESWHPKSPTLRCSGLHFFKESLIYSTTGSGDDEQTVITRPGFISKALDNNPTSNPEHLVSGLVFHENNKRIHFYPKALGNNENRFPASAQYVSPDNWYIDCLGQKFVVHKPNGTAYTLDILEHRNTGFFRHARVFDVGHKTIYVSQIKDANNNTLTYNYQTQVVSAPKWRSVSHGLTTRNIDQKILKSIASNDGRIVTLEHDPNKHSCDHKVITGIKYNKNSALDMNYSYDGCKLNTAVKKGGSFWKYTYYSPLSGSAGNSENWPEGDTIDAYNTSGHAINALKTVTFPEGAKATYTYKARSTSDFQGKDFHYEGPNGNIAALARRSISGVLLPDNMTWDFSYSINTDLGRALTTIDGPPISGKRTRHAYEYGRSELHLHAKSVHPQSGKIKKLSILSMPDNKTLRSTEYVWGWHGSVVNFNNHYTTTTGRVERAHHTLIQSRGRRVVSRTISQDGETFVTQYNNFDVYGNPRTIGRLHPTARHEIDKGQTLELTYYYNKDQWVMGKLKSRSVHPTNTQGTVLDRTFNNSSGNILSESINGIMTKYSYHPNGEVRQLIDGSGKVLRGYENYKLGVAQDVSKPDGQKKLIVNAKGQVQSESDWIQGSNKTSYQYNDPLGRVSRETPVHDAPILTSWPVWHNAAHNQYRNKYITQGNNYRHRIYYDTLGRAMIEYKQDTGSGDIVRTYRKYDAVGRIAFESLPTTQHISSSAFFSGTHPVGMTYEYDALGRILRETHSADNTATHYCYGAACEAMAPFSDSGFREVYFGVGSRDHEGYYSVVNYRAYGHPDNKQIIQTLQQHGTTPLAHVATQIWRDRRGFITKVSQDGLDRHYTYKPGRKLLHTLDHPETGITKYELYDAAGNLKIMRDADNVEHVYSYDSNNRLTKVNHKNPTEDVTYQYNKNDQVSKITSGNVVNDYVYRNDGSLDYETLKLDGQTFKLDYGYNTYGYIDQIKYPSGFTLNQHVGALGRLRSITDIADALSYYPNGQLKNADLNNDQTFITSQSAKQLPKIWKALSANSTAMSLKYDYNTKANVSKITDYVIPGNTVKNLKYDGMNRLTRADGQWGVGNIDYNNKGNITAMKLGAETLSYNYNHTYPGNRSNLLFKVTSYTGLDNYTFDYDQRGNVIDNDRVSFAYDYANRLLHADANGRVYDFLYDGKGKRVRSFHRDTDANNNPINTSNVTEYFFYNNDGHLLFEKNNTTGHIKEYVFTNGKSIAYHSTHSDTHDSDADGIPDHYEELYGMAPDNSSDALSDADGDGLTAAQEYQLGANPNSSDTDNDGMSDTDEERYQLDITHNDRTADPDGDGVNNYNEIIAGTNPSDHLAAPGINSVLTVIRLLQLN